MRGSGAPATGADSARPRSRCLQSRFLPRGGDSSGRGQHAGRGQHVGRVQHVGGASVCSGPSSRLAQGRPSVCVSAPEVPPFRRAQLHWGGAHANSVTPAKTLFPNEVTCTGVAGEGLKA